MRQQYARRMQALAVAMVLIAFAIIMQMARIQNSPEAAIFRQQASNYAYELRTFYPDRGEIFDRSGHMLAGNKTVYEIGVNLSIVKDPHAIASVISVELGRDYAQVLDAIQNPPENVTYVVLADFVDMEPATRIRELKKTLQDNAEEGIPGSLTGLEFKSHPQRSYPENSLASNVIGFVSREGRGYFGIEEKYDTLLAGSPVQAFIPTDPNKAFEIPRVLNGTTLVLTIDRDLQAAAERILDESLDTYGANGGVIAVMDPRNGELLAMASTPRMDLNQFWNYGTIYNNASEFNPAISMPYEPGSVTKILTMAAALDSGTVTPGTTYLDTGAILVGGHAADALGLAGDELAIIRAFALGNLPQGPVAEAMNQAHHVSMDAAGHLGPGRRFAVLVLHGHNVTVANSQAPGLVDVDPEFILPVELHQPAVVHCSGVRVQRLLPVDDIEGIGKARAILGRDVVRQRV